MFTTKEYPACQCNEVKHKAWCQITSEISISCYTKFQVYVTLLIHNNSKGNIEIMLSAKLDLSFTDTLSSGEMKPT